MIEQRKYRPWQLQSLQTTNKIIQRNLVTVQTHLPENLEQQPPSISVVPVQYVYRHKCFSKYLLHTTSIFLLNIKIASPY